MESYLGLQKISPELSNLEVAEKLENYLLSYGLLTTERDWVRPWGGFHRVEKGRIKRFIELFFGGIDFTDQPLELLDPKVMAVAPGKRLSLQRHDRRGEYWSILTGPVQAFVQNDEFPDGVNHVLGTGDTLWIPQSSIHRLIGMDNWGIVPEIWKHTSLEDLSSEADIYRLEDDHGRAKVA